MKQRNREEGRGGEGTKMESLRIQTRYGPERPHSNTGFVDVTIAGKIHLEAF
jgi:hypothetical protein